MPHTEEPITLLYHAMRDGDRSAEARLFDLIYLELCRFAKSLLSHERPDAVTTARGLVHEMYAKLSKSLPAVQDRRHLQRLLNKMMREINQDWVRYRKAKRREGSVLSLNTENRRKAEKVNQSRADPVAGLMISAGLYRLAQDSPTGAKLLRLRLIEGLTLEEVAEQLGIKKSAVHSAEKVARAKLVVILRRSGH